MNEGRTRAKVAVAEPAMPSSSNIAKGFTLEKSVEMAKDYISGALAAMLDLGKGSGPMNHAFALSGEFAISAE